MLVMLHHVANGKLMLMLIISLEGIDFSSFMAVFNMQVGHLKGFFLVHFSIWKVDEAVQEGGF